VRVIAGTVRGRQLTAPRGHRTRPTSDRVREALFSSLAEQIPGAVVLDLFAGSGALGIEALSRGAEYAVFVDDDRQAVRTIVGNLASLRLRARATVLELDAARFCAQPPAERIPLPHDVVLADPPYATPLPRVLGMLGDLADAGGLAEDAVLVVERDRRDPDLARAVPDRFDHLRDRTYGDTVLRYLALNRRAEP
jgi:16S rRNA (guanine966-N2)-methyltransferase